jgi:hypothetical protein
VVWLDGRNSAFDFDDPETGTMELRFAAFDANWKQTADAEIDHRVCECCSTTAAATSDGVLTAFRDLTPEGVRDIGVSRLESGKWTATALVNRDNWRRFRPGNGPMLSARGRDVAAAWFTVKDDLGQAHVASAATPDGLERAYPPGRCRSLDASMWRYLTARRRHLGRVRGRAIGFPLRAWTGPARSLPPSTAAVSGGRASGFPRSHGGETSWSA